MDVDEPTTDVQPCLEETPTPNIILGCGHPCMMCMQQQNIPVRAFTRDHTYHQTAETPVNSVQTLQPDSDLEYTAVPYTTDIPMEQPEIEPTCSTPVKLTVAPENTCYMDIEEDIVNLSDLSSFRDDPNDNTYVESDLEIESDVDNLDVTTQLDLVTDKKYIVFDTCIRDLLVRLKCPECDSAVDPDDICLDNTDSALFRCSVYCSSGHLIVRWASQPVLGKMAAGNLLTCAAILFSGQTYTHVSQFASFLNLKIPALSTFTRIQRENLMPVILHTWTTLQEELLKQVKESGRMLRLAGDGRCDSPGYNAKYCTYSLLNMETDAILSFVVVQVTETGSSCRMELEGFKRCMNYLLDLGFRIHIVATDRHVQIRSAMTKLYSGVNHQFDVWHLAKNVKKKLTQKAKMKGCEELAPWIKSISNHLWWCAAQCGGDKGWLEECWKSVVHHISNVHEFDGEKLTQCPHEPLDPEVAKRKKWLSRGSKAHNALKEVVLDKRLIKDIRQLSEFCHTGSLEVYHSLMLKYVPKRQEFDFDQMVARTALAVIDHNMSRNRAQATNKKGEKVFRLAFPKATSEWVAKPVYESKSYGWVLTMMRKLLQEKESRTLSPIKVSRRGNIATKPAPPKAEIVLKLTSRFKKDNPSS